jgi:hypothetical protein
VSLVDSHRSEGPSLALVSTVFGFAFPFHSRFGDACLIPQLYPEGSSQPFFAPFSGVAELGERFHSASMPSVSKPFQRYHRKVRESRFGQLDEKLVAESVAALRLPVSFSAKEAVAELLEMNLAGGADSVKGFVKPPSLKGFLRRGFLNPSSAVKASTHISLLEMGMSSSTPKVEEVRVRDSLPLGWLRHSICWKL